MEKRRKLEDQIADKKKTEGWKSEMKNKLKERRYNLRMSPYRMKKEESSNEVRMDRG